MDEIESTKQHNESPLQFTLHSQSNLMVNENLAKGNQITKKKKQTKNEVENGKTIHCRRYLIVLSIYRLYFYALKIAFTFIHINHVTYKHIHYVMFLHYVYAPPYTTYQLHLLNPFTTHFYTIAI